jgi:hypothetical protein
VAAATKAITEFGLEAAVPEAGADRLDRLELASGSTERVRGLSEAAVRRPVSQGE